MKEGNMLSIDELMSVRDIDASVRSFRSFEVEEIGNNEWLKQSLLIEQLITHQNSSEGLVIRAMRLHQDSVWKALVNNLVALDLWRSHVLPEISTRNNSLQSFILHSEVSLIVLMDAYLLDYIGDMKSVDLDLWIALLDYCAHSMSWLLAKRKYPAKHTNFRICVMATTRLARHFCENLMNLPVLERMLDTFDFLLVFIQLIMEPPWTHCDGNGQWQKYSVETNAWTTIAPEKILILTPIEGSIWVCVYCLTCGFSGCQARYRITRDRQIRILKIKPIVAALVDQLEILKEVQKYILHIEALDVESECFDPAPSIQVIDLIKDNLQRNQDWHEIASSQETKLSVEMREALQDFASMHLQSFMLDSDSTAVVMPPPPRPDFTQQITLEMTGHDGAPVKFQLNFVDETEPTESQVEGRLFLKRKASFDRIPTTCWIHSQSAVVAAIPLQNNTMTRTLRCAAMDLDSEKTREWRQLGKMDDDLVLQLGFKRKKGSENRYYFVDKAFLSYPKETN